MRSGEGRRGHARSKARHARVSGGAYAGQGAAVALVVAAVVLVVALGALAVRALVPAQGPDVLAKEAAAGQDVANAPAPVEEPAPDLSRLAGWVKAGKVSSIRVIGDSITAGYLTDGADEPSDTGVVVYEGPLGSYDETATTATCWANAFRQYAASKGIANFVNAGVSGFRMQFLAESPSSWLGEGADAIVVMLGTNDAAKEPVEEFEAYARTALAAAAQKCQHLVVVSPPNNKRTDAVNRYGMDQIDDVLAGVCAEKGYEHVSLMDALVLGSDDFNPDQVHPTSAGSLKLWEALRTRLDL